MTDSIMVVGPPPGGPSKKIFRWVYPLLLISFMVLFVLAVWLFSQKSRGSDSTARNQVLLEEELLASRGKESTRDDINRTSIDGSNENGKRHVEKQNNTPEVNPSLIQEKTNPSIGFNAKDSSKDSKGGTSQATNDAASPDSEKSKSDLMGVTDLADPLDSFSGKPVGGIVDSGHTAKSSSYTVRQRDSLWNIAARSEIYGDPWLWNKLFEANRKQIRDPNLIYPNQIIIVPRD